MLKGQQPPKLGLSSSVGRAQGWKLWGRWFESNLRQDITSLFLTKVLRNIPYLVLKNKLFRTKNTSLLITDTALYYLSLHLKLGTSERSTQLTEIFAYELPVTLNNVGRLPSTPSTLLVYQFHNLFSQHRLNVFVVASVGSSVPLPKSLGELFFSSTWLEREVSEMHGINFGGKRDLRNLMLQYGDTSTPFRKSYPSVGTKEVFYDSVTDTLVQLPVSIQV